MNIVSRCMPLDSNDSNRLFAAAIVFSDLLKTYSVVALLGFVLSMALSFLFLLTIRMPLVLRATVWLCVWLVLGILSFGCYSILLLAKGEESYRRQSIAEIALLKSVGYLLGIAAICWASFILFMR